jgi:hypothetical protein
VKRILIIFVIALPFIISFAFLVATKRPVPLPDAPLPNPNGYDQFIAAAGMLQEHTDSYDTMSEAELAALVATNTEPLALAQSAFTNECRVPVQYSLAYLSANLKVLEGFKYLAQTMTAKGRLAELQNHPVEAARDYLDVIHFGTESGRGGFVLDALFGIAIEEIGQDHLKNLVNNLDAASCRTTAATLESLYSHRQAWDDIVNKEEVLTRRLSPNLFGYLAESVVMYRQLSEARKKAEKALQKKQVETQNLAIQFAARAYELDKGKPPTSSTDLVPTYLKAMPKDPTTGKDMVYPPR